MRFTSLLTAAALRVDVVTFLIPLPQLLHNLTPDQAVATATCGLLLIFLELNRPGKIIAGSCGLLLLLFAMSAFLAMPLRGSFFLLFMLTLAIFFLNLYKRIPAGLLVLSTLGLVVSLGGLVRPSNRSFIHFPYALVCGGLLGAVSSVLTRIAHRARRAKALN